MTVTDTHPVYGDQGLSSVTEVVTKERPSHIGDGREDVTHDDPLMSMARAWFERERELERTSPAYRRILAARATGETCAECGEAFEAGQLTWHVGLPTGLTNLVDGRPIFSDVLVCTDCVVIPSWWVNNSSAAEYRDEWFPPTFALTCPICGRCIRYRDARYRLGVCSARCARAADAARKRDERAVAQLYRDYTSCEACGGCFKPRRSDAKFCSSACRQKAYRERKSPTGSSS